VATEAATYHRIRSAVSAAQKTGAATVLSGSTELSVPAAAEYASNFMALEGIRDVRVSIGVGTLEIGPATPTTDHPVERRKGDRRAGGDRRQPRK
jgi:CO/xanthine dehydrogenase FAD-binding subunit